MSRVRHEDSCKCTRCIDEIAKRPRYVGDEGGPRFGLDEHLMAGATTDLLTSDEHGLVQMLGQCVNLFGATLDELHGRGWRSDPGFSNAATGDAREFMQAIHVCQNIVLSRAAGRAFPEKYRP